MRVRVGPEIDIMADGVNAGSPGEVRINADICRTVGRVRIGRFCLCGGKAPGIAGSYSANGIVLIYYPVVRRILLKGAWLVCCSCLRWGEKGDTRRVRSEIDIVAYGVNSGCPA